VSRGLSGAERFAAPFPGLGMVELATPRPAGVWAVGHATIEVYDAGGGPLVSKQSPEVLGGGVYTVIRT
jgi:hypothetical protein